MQSANAVNSVRRSSRVPVTLPVVVTSLEPDKPFSEICETLVVSAHGCVMYSPVKLDAGLPVQFKRKEGRATMAHVVDCQPMGSGQQGWQLGARLDRPENFWGLEACPEDWIQILGMHSAELSRKLPAGTRDDKGRAHDQAVPSLKIVREKTSSQLTDQDLRTMLAEMVQPLHAEVAELKERLARGAPKRSQFEISLTHIPPEVEEKLWIRLRQDLGAQVLQQTRQQSEQVLEATKEAIGKKIREAQNEFREHVTQELQKVEQQAQALSEEIAGTVGEHLQSGTERFQQQASEAGSRVKHQGEEHLRSLQQRLGEEHAAYRREMQQVQAAAASESSRLQTQVTGLGARISELDDCACRLESGLDARLSQMANDAISGARIQLETQVDVVLKELGSRNAKELGIQLDDACGKLKTVQKGIETSVSELVRTQIAATLLSFGETMDALAQDSVGRWRVALAKDLDSVAKILGGQFRLEGASDSREKQESE
jgi:hypothetical protein